MNKLDEIEARYSSVGEVKTIQVADDLGLLIRAVRQLGPFAKHAQHHISCETFDDLECSCDLDNQLAGIDPDVLELIAEGAREGEEAK